MNLLFLTHRTPYPPNRGDRIRAYHLLRLLSKHSRVSLASVSQERTRTEHVNHLKSYCERISIQRTSTIGRAFQDIRSVALGRSASEGHFWSPRLASTIREWDAQRPFDVVVCFCSGMYRYTRLVNPKRTKIVVDLCDVDSEKWNACAKSARWPVSLVMALESHRVLRLEEQIATEATKIAVISCQEEHLFRRLTGRTNAMVVGNGVDTEYFRPLQVEERPETCCFVGVLNYRPNVEGIEWFVSRVWPTIRRQRPEAKLQIVGRTPCLAVKRLARTRGVEIHADVPDVRPYVCRSTAAIAPMNIARGVQNKVLEAMAMNKAVVTTPAALAGIEAKAGTEIVQAEGADAWRNALLSLFDEERYRRQIGNAARQFVVKNHSWEGSLAPMRDAIGSRNHSVRRDPLEIA